MSEPSAASVRCRQVKIHLEAPKLQKKKGPSKNFLEEAGVPQGFLQIAYAKSW